MYLVRESQADGHVVTKNDLYTDLSEKQATFVFKQTKSVRGIVRERYPLIDSVLFLLVASDCSD